MQGDFWGDMFLILTMVSWVYTNVISYQIAYLKYMQFIVS